METTTIYTRFFRGGVGTVIYNKEGQVALFQRAQYPVGIWQFQQGGIDNGENFQQTLWRELREEVGLEMDDFCLVTEYPNWTVYATQSALDDPSKSRLGQAHKWFFLELKEGVEIDLSKALEEEASDFRWTTFDDAICETEETKKHVYKELKTYFEANIKKKL